MIDKMLLPKGAILLLLSSCIVIVSASAARGQTTVAAPLCPVADGEDDSGRRTLYLQGDCIWHPALQAETVVSGVRVGSVAWPPAVVAPSEDPGTTMDPAPPGSSASFCPPDCNSHHG